MNNLTSLQPSKDKFRAGGFTLIELMVAMALSLFLIGGVVLMYASSKAAYSDSDRLARLQENIRFASDYMVRDIRNAGFRDEQTLLVVEETAVRNKMAEIRNNGKELIVRYAGRGHCEQEFDDFRIVENRYFLDAGELRCAGGSLEDDNGNGNLSDDYDSTDDPGFSLGSSGQALVEGLTDINFEFIMVDGSTETESYECTIPLDPSVGPGDRCLAVRIGLEFEGLRDLDTAGDFEERFVELLSTFRNSALESIYTTGS